MITALNNMGACGREQIVFFLHVRYAACDLIWLHNLINNDVKKSLFLVLNMRVR